METINMSETELTQKDIWDFLYFISMIVKNSIDEKDNMDYQSI